MTLQAPADLADFTPAWLTRALSAEFEGVEVASVEQVGRSLVTNLHLRLRLTFANQAGAPTSLFAKLPPLDPGHRAAIGATGMGLREARFYREIAPSLKLRTPRAYHADIDETDGSFVLLLEDLAARGCALSDGSWSVSGDLAAQALEDLADMHVRFEDSTRRGTVAPWMVKNDEMGEFTVGMLRYVLDEHADKLSDDYVAVGELYIERRRELEALWDSGPQTLAHGDTHIGNLFIDGDRVGFLDWGLVTVSGPMRDVSYFLTLAAEPNDGGTLHANLVRHYLATRAALGGAPLSFDEAWMAHRVNAGYTVIASFLGLMPPYDSPEVQPFAKRFRERSMLALEELDSLSAIRRALS